MPGGSEQGGTLRVRFEGLGLPRIFHLLPPRGSSARRRRAFVVLIRFSTEPVSTAPMDQFVSE